MNLRNDACDRIALFAREGRLIQHSWHHTADDGRKLACLLGAIGPDVTSPGACPADVMPGWLAHLLPTLFDGLPAERTADFGLRFAAALRSGSTGGGVRRRWLARAAADARASARAAADARASARAAADARASARAAAAWARAAWADAAVAAATAWAADAVTWARAAARATRAATYADAAAVAAEAACATATYADAAADAAAAARSACYARLFKALIEEMER